MKLEMNLYANKKYKLMYTINKNPDEYNRMIKNFYYEIDSSNYTISTIEDNEYKIHTIINNTKEEFPVISIPTNKLELKPVRMLPFIYDYGTSKNKTEKDFTISFDLDKDRKLDISFDKKYYVAYDREIKKCEVYGKSNDIIDMNNKIEEYIFTEQGYLYINFEEFRIVFTFYNSNERSETEFESGKRVY